MEWERQKYWVALNMVLGIGKTLFYRLVRAFGSPRAVFQASQSQLMGVEKIGEKTARQILDFDVAKNLAREEKKLETLGARIATLECPEYPELLSNIYDPPPILYYIGRPPNELPLPLAVVGTRKASSYGRTVAEKLCQELASRGFTVVSGMARGIDSLAHRAALLEDRPTAAVLGCGLEHTYPPENRSLRQKIVEKGTLISEFPLSMGPDRNNFPARNRVISGMSLGTLVIEAGEKSGALITADFALEQGREVFAVPGQIYSRNSVGTHRLIQMGAKLVDGVESLIEELPESAKNELSKKKREPSLENRETTEKEKHLLDLLSTQERHIDELIENSYLSPAEVSATLVQLELKGIVRQSEGKIFSSNTVSH